jgi:hypothetical protein
VILTVVGVFSNDIPVKINGTSIIFSGKFKNLSSIIFNGDPLNG